MHTKKIGSMGRFGPRYGKRVKKINSPIEKIQKQRHKCPYCERSAVKRVASGIWTCRKCNAKFSGGAYKPVSDRLEQMLIKKAEEKSDVNV